MKTFAQIYKWQLATFVLLLIVCWPYVSEVAQWFANPDSRQAIVNAFLAFGGLGTLGFISLTVYHDYKTPHNNSRKQNA